MKYSKSFFKLFLTFYIMLTASCNKTINENIFLKMWDGPYDGIPHFDKMNIDEIKPAVEKALELSLKEINEIANQKDTANFENTIGKMERSGEVLNRVYPYYGIYSNNLSGPKFQKIQTELAPKISDYSNKIYQNNKLFERIKKVFMDSKNKPLDSIDQRLIDLTYKRFIMNGAELDSIKKLKYADINNELSTLYTKFSNNILSDEENYTTFLSENELSGLSESFINTIKNESIRLGKNDKFAISNTRSSMDPFLKFSENRNLRKQVWENYYSRADNNDEHDNKSIIEKILKLRKERVNILGYDYYPEWRLQDRMAKSPENALKLLLDIWPSSIKTVEKEVEEMQKIADKDNVTIEPWDYRFYAEKVRNEKYDYDSEEVKSYLQLENLKDAMFFVAKEIFNLEFKEIEHGKVPVFHQDVSVWEVYDIDENKLIGLWYLDPFSRPGKRSGAWATTYRSYGSFNEKEIILASNNSNFLKPAKGEAALVSWDDAETFFHEFGHALQYYCSKVKYSSLNGGVRDYIEFHSQLLERWLYTDEILFKYLTHFETGESIPKSLVEKIKKASTFNQGFATTEYLASAIIDMKIHLTNPENIDISEFEKTTLDNLDMPKELVMRHRTPHFAHVFSGEGYATAYYGYIWSEVLTADVTERFSNSKDGLYNKELSKKLVKTIFETQNTIDAMDAFTRFMGREPKIDALMKDRGFIK